MIDAALVEDLGDRFAAAIFGGDMAALEDLFAPNFRIWYNVSDTSLDREQAITFFADYFTRIKTCFRDVKRHVTPTGWVEEHRIDATGADGYRLNGVPACVIFTLDNGLISSIDEYFDSRQTGSPDTSQKSNG